jgi:hypothetical protein
MEITVFRPQQYNDKFRDYKLFVDDEEVTTVNMGERKVILISDSAKSIQAKIDWCTSPTFPVSSIISGQITVKNSFSGSILKTLFLPIYYITFGKSKYLTIETGL